MAPASPRPPRRAPRACRRCPRAPAAPPRARAPRRARRPAAVALEQPQQQPRIDAARAGRHHEPLERREAHRGVDRAAVGDRAQRCAGAEVAADEPQPGRRATEQLGDAPGDPGMREAVEAVAPQPPALAPGRRERVGRGRRGQRSVEGGVEARDGRQLGQLRAHRVERGDRLRLVQRREVAELAQRRLDVRVDPHGRGEALAAVDDAMADGVRVGQAIAERAAQRADLDGPARRFDLAGRDGAVLAVEQRQLQRARAGVDHQHAHGARPTRRRSCPATPSRGSRAGRRRPRACRRGGAAACRPSPGAGRRPARRGRGRGR